MEDYAEAFQTVKALYDYDYKHSKVETEITSTELITHTIR
jgi:hypothetical protein